MTSKPISILSLENQNTLGKPTGINSMIRSHPELFMDASYNWEMWRNEDGIISYVSPSCERMTGYIPQEFCSNPNLFLEILHPDERQMFVDHIADLESIDKIPLLFRIIHKNGDIHWIDHFCSPMYDQNGNFLGRHTTNNDVTFQVKAEERHRLLAEEYRLLLEHSPDLIARFDRNHRHLYVNEIAARAGVLSASEYIGKSILESGVSEKVAQIWDERINKVFSTGKMLEVEDEFPTPEGFQYFNTRLLPEFSNSGEVQAVISIARNITDQKIINKTLKIQSSALQASANAIVITDRDGKIEWINPAWSRLTGFTFEEVLGKNPRILKSGFQNTAFYQNLWNTILTGAVWRGELVNQRKDGSLYTEEQTITPVTNEIGVITHFIAIKEDITHRKILEKNLSQSEAKLQSLFAAITDIIIVYDADGRYIEISPSSPIYHKIPWNEIVGKTVYEILPSPVAKFIHQRVLECLQVGHLENIEYSIGNNGNTDWFLSNAKQLTSNTVLWVSRQITRRKQNELELRQRLNELEAANQISRKLRSVETVQELSKLLLDETLATIGSENGAVWMYDPDKQILRPIISSGWFHQLLPIDVTIDEGITGHVYKTGFPYISEDYKKDKLISAVQFPFIPEGWGGASIPIISDQKVIGVLTVSVQLPRFIRDEDVKILNLISEIAGNAIHRSDLHQQTITQLQRLESLHKIDHAIISSNDQQELFSTIIAQVVESLTVDAADILLRNSATNQLEYKVGLGFKTNIVDQFSDCIGDGISKTAFIEKRIVKHEGITLLSQEPCEKVKFHNLEGFSAHYSIPLMGNNFPHGVLNVYFRKKIKIDQGWMDHFSTLASQVSIAINKLQSEKEIQNSQNDLEKAYTATLEGWSKALDLRDEDTEGHTERVVELVLRFAKYNDIPDEELVQIERGAILHDIGKMGVPDRILHKKEPLTAEDWKVIRKHPVYAYEMLLPITYLQPALDIPYCHHENWDGSGYPRGLKGKKIPLGARMFSLVDVFDALTSDRVYRKAWTKENALAHIKEQSGIKFDPDLVPKFLEMIRDDN